VASKSITYEALGTTWKVHRDLSDSPGLAFIQDYLSHYDFSELEWVTLKAGSWGGESTYPEEETYGWTNAVTGLCHYPVGTRSGLYRVNNCINTRLGWPAIVYQSESPLYLTEAGTWPDVPDDCFTGKRYIDEKSGREWQRLIRRLWLQDEHEAVAYILAHELFHFLRRTRQIPGKNVEIEADRYGVQVLEVYRLNSRDTRTRAEVGEIAEAVTDTDTRCLECGQPLASDRRTFCSDKCRWTYHNRERRRRTATDREKTCEVCAKEFVAKRSDAKTCSARCRQTLRRQRH
jgi:predicted nucleic acid-binding Zn ribbon protein